MDYSLWGWKGAIKLEDILTLDEDKENRGGTDAYPCTLVECVPRPVRECTSRSLCEGAIIIRDRNPPLLPRIALQPLGSICWIANTVFAILYAASDGHSLFLVSTPKDSPVVYTNSGGVCFGNNSDSKQKYFFHLEPLWGIFICASIDSIEIAVLGNMVHVRRSLQTCGRILECEGVAEARVKKSPPEEGSCPTSQNSLGTLLKESHVVTVRATAVFGSICWIANTVFAILYAASDGHSLFLVSTPKDSPVVYTNSGDVCLGNNSDSRQKYFFHLEPLCSPASSNSSAFTQWRN